MNKSQRIRELYSAGLPLPRIADELGIKYQFAYNVVKAAGIAKPTGEALPQTPNAKPKLTVDRLIAGGFELESEWVLSQTGALQLSRALSAKTGVYAFTIDGIARYVGITLNSFQARMNLYRGGHSSQKTNERLKALIVAELIAGTQIHIYTVSPPAGEWNGWPINTAAGLEIDLIRLHDVLWNRKGV